MEVEALNFVLTFPLADTWNGHHMSGWWFLLMLPMMAFMGAMMWMMMRGMMGGGSSPDADASVSRETPMEILERRFAEGEISIEDYRARRDALVDAAAEVSGDDDAERLVASGSRGGEP